jgi:hypothetical protein
MTNVGTYFSPTGGSSGSWSVGSISGQSVPGITSNILATNAITNRVGLKLGGGLSGVMPQHVVNQDADNEYAQTRFLLRDAWNTTRYSGQDGKVNKRIITPFRAVNNAGDVLSRQNYSCGGNTQTFQSRPGMFGLKGRFGAIQSNCDETLVPPAACNVKYVYDSSDYARYVKHRAINRNYNDRSNGGNDYSGAQSAIRAIHRY